MSEFTLKVDSTGDLTFIANRLETITGGDKLSQDLQLYLKTQFKEDVFNPTYGLDQSLIRENNSEAFAVTEVSRSLLDHPRVDRIIEVRSLGIDKENREIALEARIQLVTGVSTILNVVL